MTLGFALVLALIFLAWLLDRAEPLVAGVRLALFFAGGLSVSGHDALDPGSSWKTEIADWVHLSAASLWIGGLASLVGLVWLGAPQLRRAAFRRFSQLATVLIAVVLAAGTYLGIVRLPHLHDLWSESYGRVLLVKLGLVSFALLWGAFHKFVVGPALERADDGFLDPHRAKPGGREHRRRGGAARRGGPRRLQAAASAGAGGTAGIGRERRRDGGGTPVGRGRSDTSLVELTDYRERFPILASTTYLINHSLGAMPAEAERRLERFAREWPTRGARAWGEGWWDTAVEVGDLVGAIIGAPPGSTVMHQNVTVAEAIVLSCFEFETPRNRIVFEEGLFPSVRYVQQAWSRFGAEVVVCEDAEAVIEAIDERTLLVPVSHVLYKTAEIQPVERIVERAREAGAYVCLDAYQSAGAVPLDVTRSGSSSASAARSSGCAAGPAPAGSTCGRMSPSGSSPRSPAGRATPGRSRSRPEMQPARGAARFLTGTPIVAANYAASAGYEIVREIGVDRIRANSMRQTALLVELIDAAGFELTSPREPAVRGGSVVFRVPDFQAVHAELAARDIICDYRPDAGLRFGPHFFTTDDEIRFAVDQVTEILAAGAHMPGRARRRAY